MKLKILLQILILSSFSYIAQATTNSYVCNYDSDSVSVINTATNAVIATVTVGNGPISIATTPDGSKAYVSNYFSETVSVINTLTNTVSATLTVGGYYPDAIVSTPDGTQVYVACFNSPGTASAINTATNAVTNISVGNNPRAIAITGTKAYVCNGSSGTVSVIDTGTNTVSATITVGTTPSAIAITPNGSKAYVCNRGAGTISVINTTTDTVIGSPITVGTFGQSANEIAITPDGTQVYVSNTLDQTVSVISTTSDTVVHTSTFSINPAAIAITPNSAKAYIVAEEISGSVIAVNTSTYGEVSISVGGNPGAIVITSDGTKAYVSNQLDGTVSVITTASNTVSATITVGTNPGSIALASAATTPTANPQSVSFVVNSTDNPIQLTGTDPGSLPLSYTILSSPTHGTLIPSFSTGAYLYTPYNGYAGSDSFTFFVTNTLSESSTPATVSITVNPAGAPIANPTAVSVVQNVGTVITLTGLTSQPNLTFSIVSGPSYGTLSGLTQSPPTSATVTYTSTGSYAGSDSFTFKVTDNLGLVSATVTVPVMIFLPSTKAYIADTDNDDIGMISVSVNNRLNVVTDSGNLINNPSVIAISPNGLKAYIGNDATNTVTSINALTNTVTGNVNGTASPFNSPNSIAFTPDGAKAYVVNGAGSVSIINTATDATIGSVAQNGFSFNSPNSIAITPDGTKAYVANQSGNNVSIVDLNSSSATYNKVVGYITDSGTYLTGVPSNIVISPDGSTAYVVNQTGSSGRGSVVIINVATNATTGIVDDSTYNFNNPIKIAITLGGAKAYVVNYNDSKVSIINLATNTVTGFVTDLGSPTFNHPVAVSFSADGTKAYVANQTGNSVSIIDVVSNTVTSSISGYNGPRGVAFLGGPIANQAAASVVQNVGTSIQLTGVADSGTLTFAITSAPSHGALTGFSRISATRIQYTYTSDASYVGADSFAFTVTDAIGTSSAATVSVVVMPPSVRAYVTDGNNNDIGLVSVDLGTAVGTVTDYSTPLINASAAIAISPDGTKAYVANNNNTVSSVNPLTNTVIRNIDQALSTFDEPVSIAFTPDGSKAYVVNLRGGVSRYGSVSIINTATDAAIGSVDSTSFPFNRPDSIAIASDGMKAYVANVIDNHVSIIDLNSSSATYNKVVGYVADSGSYLTGSHIDIVISPDGGSAYVVNETGSGGRGSVVIVNVANDAATGIIDDSAHYFNNPFSIAITADGAKAYVPNFSNNSVSVIDLATSTVTGFVTDLGSPTFNNPIAVSFSADGAQAYVVNETGNSVSVIDVASNTVTSSIAGYHTPGAVAFLGGPAANQIAAIALRNSQITVTVSVTPDSAPATFSIVTQPSYGTLTSVSSTSTSHTYHYASNGMYSGPDSFVAQVTNPLNPLPIEITVPIVVTLPSTRAYVADSGHDNAGIISVANAASAGTITDSAHLLDGPGIIAVSSQGSKAYVGNSNNTVTSINALTNAVIGNVSGVFDAPYDIAFTPDGTKAYVVSFSSNSVNVINAQTDAVIESVDPQSFPFNDPTSIVIMPDGMKAYVVNQHGNNVSIIDIDSSSATYNKVVGYVVDVNSLLSGQSLEGIAITPDGTRAYVVNQLLSSSAVVIIDAINDIVTGAVDENGYPFDQSIAIAISPDGTKAYVSNDNVGSVSVIDVNPGSGNYNKVTGFVTDGSSTFFVPVSIVFSADGSLAYVANLFGYSVSIIDVASDTVTSSISGYSGPYAVAFLGFGGPFFSITNAYVSPVASSLDTTTGIMYEVGNAQDGSGDVVLMATNASSVNFGPVASFTKSGQSDHGVISYSTTSLLNIDGTSFTQLDMALQKIGAGQTKVIVSGSNDLLDKGFVARFNTIPVANSLDGVLDDTFGDYQSGSSGPQKGYAVFNGVGLAAGFSTFSSCGVDADQKIVVAGSVGVGGGTSTGQLIVARYTLQGILDTTFGPQNPVTAPQLGYGYSTILGLSGTDYSTIVTDIEFDPLKNIFIVGQYTAPLIPAPGLSQNGVAGTSPFIAKFVRLGIPDQTFYTQFGTFMIPVQYVNGQGEFNKCLYDVSSISNLSSPTMYASGIVKNLKTSPVTDYATLIRFTIANLNLSASQAFISGNSGAPLTNLNGNLCPSLVVPSVTKVAQISRAQGSASTIFNSIKTSQDVQNIISLPGVVANLISLLQGAGASATVAQSIGDNFQATMRAVIDNFVANYPGNLLQNFLYLSQSIAVNECLLTTDVSRFIYLQLIYAAEKSIQINIKTAASYCTSPLISPYG